MSINFTCKAFGKCILLGEHAVLRGVPALVTPIRSRFLELTYSRSEQPLDLRLHGDHGNELQILVWSVLDRACQMIQIPRTDLKGTLMLESSIPVGAGMGASGALCVALTRWLGFLGYVPESDYYEFARTLENIFHGESSGVDIAVALTGEGLRFVRNGERSPLRMNWQPQWYISYTGKRGVTIDAVNKVKDLIANDPVRGKKIDEEMRQAVSLAEQALQLPAAEGRAQLIESLELAGKCFEQWGLNEGAPAEHIALLRKSGAVAVKPTGSGGGGYVLSLWDQTPPQNLNLIPC